MNKPAPFSERQYQYFLRCLHSWFNVAEGGKRGGKNVLQTLIFCTLLETHKNKIHLGSRSIKCDGKTEYS